MNNCPNCNNKPAITHPVYGLVNCSDCQKKHESFAKPGRLPEFTSEDIREQRKEYKNDTEQMHFKGKLNKRWVDLYGAEQAKKHGFSETEIKKAAYTNPDEYYNKNL